MTGSYPVFEALREKFGGGWQSLAEGSIRIPAPRQVKAFAKKKQAAWRSMPGCSSVARRQLEAVQRHTQDLGMPLGLYVDLALGADRGGAEVWADQDVFAVDASCGAPPDEFNPRGQDWGLPPYSPRALRAKATGRSSICCAPTCRWAGRCAWTTSWRSRASGGSRRARSRSAAAT